MKIWENGVIREAAAEDIDLYEAVMAEYEAEDDPYDIIDTLTGEK